MKKSNKKHIDYNKIREQRERDQIRVEENMKKIEKEFIEKCISMNIPEIDYPMVRKFGFEKYTLSNELVELDKQYYGKYKGFPICPSIFHMCGCDMDELKMRIEDKKMRLSGRGLGSLLNRMSSQCIHNEFGTFLLKENNEVEKIGPEMFPYKGVDSYKYYDLCGLCG